MKAIVKTHAGPGVEILDVPEPQIKPGHVKLRVERGSVCGTDLHIYTWDPWSQARIKPPRIIGHEFCGTVVEIGEGVKNVAVGDFVASESHITCGECVQCLHDQGHVCINTVILGVDVDGGFAEYAVIPEENARHTPDAVPRNVASMQDALGNGVYTALDGPVPDRTILITGMGPIGLFAAATCKAMDAKRIVATEVSEYRMNLAKQVGVDIVLNPIKDDVDARLTELEPLGFDATLEMSGHPSSFGLAVRHTRPGGRISMLGIYPDKLNGVDMDQVVFKGLELHGITGRRRWATWDQMGWLLTEKGLDVSPVITHEMPYTDVVKAMEEMRAGRAGKVILNFE